MMIWPFHWTDNTERNQFRHPFGRILTAYWTNYLAAFTTRIWINADPTIQCCTFTLLVIEYLIRSVSIKYIAAQSSYWHIHVVPHVGHTIQLLSCGEKSKYYNSIFYSSLFHVLDLWKKLVLRYMYRYIFLCTYTVFVSLRSKDPENPDLLRMYWCAAWSLCGSDS